MFTSRLSPWFRGAALAVLSLTSSCVTGADDPPAGGAEQAAHGAGPIGGGARRRTGPRPFLIGAGARVTAIDDRTGRALAAVDLAPPEDDARPWTIRALASAGATFVALTTTPDDEGGVLHRGSVASSVGGVASGWASGDARLGAIGDELVLFERGEGARWRFVGGGPPRPSLACPIPTWLEASASPHGARVAGAAVPPGHDGPVAFEVTLDDAGFVACTTAPIAPFANARGDDVMLHAFGAAPLPRFAIAGAGGGLVLLTEQARTPIPGAFVGGALVTALAEPTAFVLLGDPAEPGVGTLLVATRAGVTGIVRLDGEVLEAPALDQLLALPHGVAVVTSAGVTRIAVGRRGDVTVSYRIPTSAPAHLARAPVTVSESSHDR